MAPNTQQHQQEEASHQHLHPAVLAAQDSLLTGLPSLQALARVTFRDLMLDPSDTRPLAEQLGLPPLLVREVFNNSISARRGEDAGGGGGAKHTPTASSDVAVFYVAASPSATTTSLR